MSDFHKLTTTILQQKRECQKIFYKDCKTFGQNTFKKIQPELTLQAIDYSQFQSTSLETLSNMVPVKINIICYNTTDL